MHSKQSTAAVRAKRSELLGDLVNYVESPQDLIALEKASQLKGVPMPDHVREKICNILNIPPVLKSDIQLQISK